MGQKTNPISLRLQTTNRYFDSCWYGDYFYSDLISQNLKIQEYLNSILKQIQYPTGRFFIRSSQKKLDIFLFFCSPLELRKKRSRFFKIKYYKTTRKKQNSLQYLKKKPTFFEKVEQSLVNYSAVNKGLDKSFVIPNRKKEEKFTNLKYYFYAKFLQNFYAIFMEDKFLHQTIKKKIKKSQISLDNIILLDNRVNTKKNLTRILPVLPQSGNQNPLLLRSRAVQHKKGLKHNSLFFNQGMLNKVERTLCNRMKLSNFVPFSNTFLRSKSIIPTLRCNQYQVIPNDNNLYSLLNKLTYRQHIEAVLARQFLLNINIYSIKIDDHYQSALFVAEEIVYLLERRIPFRRIKNKIIKEVQDLRTIKGIRITCAGRVGGRSKKAQRAKQETVKFGQTSLHVFSSRIDFASKTALTRFGIVGIKVWICFF